MNDRLQRDFEEAKRRIAECKKTGAVELDLSKLQIKTLPEEICSLTSLTSVDLSWCSSLTDVSGLSGLPSLTSVNLSRSSSLTDVSVLSGLPSLTSVDLGECSSLTDVSVLSGLTSLTSVGLSVCKNLTDVSVLSGLTSLTSVDLSVCKNLTDVSVLSGLPSLTSVNLSWCENLTDVSGLSGLTSLTSVDLGWCSSLTDVSVLSGLTSLTSVNLSRCDNLTDVSVLSGLPSLTSVNLSGCGSLTDVSVLSGLTSLTSVDLSRCENLTDVSVLSGLPSLTSVDLSWCSSLTDVSVLSGLPSLTSVDLSWSSSLTDVSVLSGLTSLTSVNLSWCKNLTDVSGLSGLPSLTSVDLSGCDNLTDVSGLSGLPSLTSVDLSECSSLTDVSGLSGLTSLTSVDLGECSSLTDVSVLSGLPSLTSVDLSRCEDLYIRKSIKDLTSLESLILYKGSFKDLPAEFYGSEYGENVLGQVRSHIDSIEEQGDSTYSEAKVIILGDAGCGKTSFVKALKEKGFDANEETTHAIRLWDCTNDLNVHTFGGNTKPTQVNVWDFGGQTVYHSAHQLFLVSRAVYVIVFRRLKEGETGRDDLSFCDPRGVRYWINMVRSIAPEVPLYIVRTHTDLDDVYAETSDERWIKWYAKRNNNIKYSELSCRVREKKGWNKFKKIFRSGINHIFKDGEEKFALAKGWVDVRKYLDEIKLKEHWITFSRFSSIVEEVFKSGPKKFKIPDKSGLLNLLKFFHNYGALFCPDNWRRGSDFNIVLDQAWFIDAIYKPFEHNGAGNWYDYIQNQQGVLPKDKLSEILYSEDVASKKVPIDILFDMMLSCNLAVSISRDDIEQKLYVLPDLLEERELMDGSLSEWEYGSNSARFKHQDWGSAFARELICTSINEFGVAIKHWKYGAEVNVALDGKTTPVWVEWCPPSDGSQYNGDLIVECRDDSDEERRTAIYQYLVNLYSGKKLDEVSKEYSEYCERYSSKKDHNTAKPSRCDFRIGFSVKGDIPAEKGDEEYPSKLCDEVNAKGIHFSAKAYYYRRNEDEKLLPNLIKTLYTSDVLLCFITPEYLKSAYCMTELLEGLREHIGREKGLSEEERQEFDPFAYLIKGKFPKTVIPIIHPNLRNALEEDIKAEWARDYNLKFSELVSKDGRTIRSLTLSDTEDIYKRALYGAWLRYLDDEYDGRNHRKNAQTVIEYLLSFENICWLDSLTDETLSPQVEYVRELVEEMGKGKTDRIKV